MFIWWHDLLGLVINRVLGKLKIKQFYTLTLYLIDPTLSVEKIGLPLSCLVQFFIRWGWGGVSKDLRTMKWHQSYWKSIRIFIQNVSKLIKWHFLAGFGEWLDQISLIISGTKHDRNKPIFLERNRKRWSKWDQVEA